MNKIQELITEAKELYGDITPCDGKKTLEDSVTVYNGYVYLWFNDSKNSTHVVRKEI